MCYKCRKTKASESALYLRYKRLLNPRVTARPPQPHWWQVSLKNESAAHPGEALSQLEQYHKQPLFFRCCWAQVVFHWLTSSNKHSGTFSQINRQDFKQRGKTNTWIWNSANQALLIKNLWWGCNERLPPVWEVQIHSDAVDEVKAAAPWAPGLMEGQPKHCCSAWTGQSSPHRQAVPVPLFCDTSWEKQGVRIHKSHLMTEQMQTIRGYRKQGGRKCDVLAKQWHFKRMMYQIAGIELAVKLKHAEVTISKGDGITTFHQIWAPIFPPPCTCFPPSHLYITSALFGSSLLTQAMLKWQKKNVKRSKA